MVVAAVSCRTLVVEDDPWACEILTKVITALGHEVECVRTVHRAMRRLKSYQPTHILLDLMLPDGNGAEVLAFVRDNDMPIKVALSTAVAGSGHFWDEAIRHAPDAVFHKPWDLDELRTWFAGV